MNRGLFIKYFGVLAASPLLLNTSCKAKNKYKIYWAPDASAIGHLLKGELKLQTPTVQRQCQVAIVGSGVSALSACRQLNKKNIVDVHIIEMLDDIGGNAKGGSNSVSAYPYAAHYLPIPALHLKELLTFLEDIKIISGWQSGKPIYNMEHVCAANQERMYMNGAWQDGFTPQVPFSKKDSEIIAAFEAKMRDYTAAKDDDGHYLFDLPARNSSHTPAMQALHDITAMAWLQKENFNSPYLLWYLEYCMGDDYGATLSTVSAWAMLHYFACRKGDGVDVNKDDVLTWPEGNQYLVSQFKTLLQANYYCSEIVMSVQQTSAGVVIIQYNHRTKQWIQTTAKHAILNIPFRILKKLFPQYATHNDSAFFKSYPWLVANITLHTPPEKKGIELSWDNIIYGAQALGYIVANHQSMQYKPSTQVFTFYKRYASSSQDANERNILRQKKLEELQEEVLADMKIIYPTIEQHIESIEIKIHGHGMIAPTPQLMSSQLFQALQLPIASNIHLAHTDYCGISIFEEAFYAGIRAANHCHTL